MSQFSTPLPPVDMDGPDTLPRLPMQDPPKWLSVTLFCMSFILPCLLLVLFWTKKMPCDRVLNTILLLLALTFLISFMYFRNQLNQRLEA